MPNEDFLNSSMKTSKHRDQVEKFIKIKLAIEKNTREKAAINIIAILGICDASGLKTDSFNRSMKKENEREKIEAFPKTIQAILSIIDNNYQAGSAAEEILNRASSPSFFEGHVNKNPRVSSKTEINKPGLS